tara:strand:- start:116 stop:463 length:348 start_codon:yes stop_codon:yes gene_type:complete
MNQDFGKFLKKTIEKTKSEPRNIDNCRYGSYVEKHINVEYTMWDSPSPSVSFTNNFELARGTIHPPNNPFGKSPPVGTPIKDKMINKMIVNLQKKYKTNIEQKSNDDEIFYLEGV